MERKMNLTVLTVATKEVSPERYACFTQTAEKYGYKYIILGREEKWQNFRTKTLLYHQALPEVTTPYVTLVDCTDLFFCAPAQELQEKLMASNNVVVGAQITDLHCPGNTLGHQKLKDYYDSLTSKSHRYPNAGFIGGLTAQVYSLISQNLEYIDDQTAIIEGVYQKKYQISLDCDSQLVGNVMDNMYPKGPGSYTDFVYLPHSKRYARKETGESPPVLHFPGKYFQAMKEFYTTNQEDIPVDWDPVGVVANGNLWVSWVLLGLLLLLLVVICYIFLR